MTLNDLVKLVKSSAGLRAVLAPIAAKAVATALRDLADTIEKNPEGLFEAVERLVPSDPQ